MFQAPRGTQDILPEAATRWRAVEAAARRRAELHGFGETRTPTFEDLDLFLRSVGGATDIVEKEMYSFRDKGGEEVALRPEATASVVRAYLQHGLFNRPQPVKLYSFVNAFRYDRPQAGRLREFHQFNCEALGEADPLVDAELIALLWGFYADLGLRELSLELNTIGDPNCRPAYVQELVTYFRSHLDELCDDDKRRLETNPLRLLDCKQPRCQPIAEAAPRSADRLCQPCAEHFTRLRGYLEHSRIPYVLNSRLVRGLDYYTRTVFEVVPPVAGGQATIGGGGRYDGLAEQLGGRPTPAVGFATGLERILLNLERQSIVLADEAPLEVFVVPLGEPARTEGFRIVERLRARGLTAWIGTGDRSARSLLRQASGLGARWAVLLGDRELAEHRATVKPLAGQQAEQITVSLDELPERLVELAGTAGSAEHTPMGAVDTRTS
ncbi:MAG: histidine--tRNA ligase [Chloroflexi bacterium]|nr:histidine--tRNA ligase [Chloroflexota bacterium]